MIHTGGTEEGAKGLSSEGVKTSLRTFRARIVDGVVVGPREHARRAGRAGLAEAPVRVGQGAREAGFVAGAGL